MGYDTKFQGRIKFSRKLSLEELRQLAKFVTERHSERFERGGDSFSDNREASYAPSLHCDWDLDSHSIFWNGSEKSYELDEWLKVLIRKFFQPWGVVLNGKMLAQGERMSDRWFLECKDNYVTKSQIALTDLGVTE